MPEAERNATNKVQGCVSQVWLATTVSPNHRVPRLSFVGDSDAHIVRGLIAILFALYSGKTADAILDIDANAVLGRLHLKEHLTPQRSNGLLAMVERIRKDAREATPSSIGELDRVRDHVEQHLLAGTFVGNELRQA